MIFEPTPIPGAHQIEIERNVDERGFFARAWCREEFAAQGIKIDMLQASISHSRLAGTLRGLHFTWPPSREGKLVRCEHGRIFDVIVDLRPTSPAFLHHFSVVLDDQRKNALYIPSGVAHGFQTLSDACDVFYMMSEAYSPELADGVRCDDPAFGILWPLEVSVMSERDRNYPDFDVHRHAQRYTDATAGRTG
ncbi:MAG: dTDP-4-dehydrorhamnose 3,5-epimerase [Zoogloea sp.]|nr:dTDP-4-dehydrorhamnose 3,5-epimerase [Zoogloea sp.]